MYILYVQKNVYWEKLRWKKLWQVEKCGNKLHKKLSLSKESVDHDKTYKESNTKVIWAF